MNKFSREHIHKESIIGIIFIFFILILICFATMKPIGFDKDSTSYLFDLKHTGYAEVTREQSFIVLSKLVNKYLKGEVLFVFLFYALCSISIKLYAIFRYSSNRFLSFSIYILLFYFIQDTTQIRVGLAAAFLILAYLNLREGKTINFFIYSFLSAFFHYQAILIFLIFLFNKLSLKACTFIALISGIVYLFFLKFFKNFLIKLFDIIHLGVISNKIDLYFNNTDLNVNASLGLFQLFYISLIVLYFAAYNYRKYLFKNQDLINLKIMLFSISMFFILSFNSVFSLRVFEYFATLLIFIIPMIINFFKQKIILSSSVILICIFYYINAVSDKINFDLYFGI